MLIDVSGRIIFDIIFFLHIKAVNIVIFGHKTTTINQFHRDWTLQLIISKYILIYINILCVYYCRSNNEMNSGVDS